MWGACFEVVCGCFVAVWGGLWCFRGSLGKEYRTWCEFTNDWGMLCLVEVLTGKERRSRDGNGEVRMLKKYAHQRETTGSNNDSLQLRPFSK